jgi:hypothetical protein
MLKKYARSANSGNLLHIPIGLTPLFRPSDPPVKDLKFGVNSHEKWFFANFGEK